MKRYTVNKGVNRPISFKGLQAQYILYLGIGLVVLLLVFAMGYVLGLSFWTNGVACGFMGYLLVEGTFKMNRKYGRHGLKKRLVHRKVPLGIKVRDREFIRTLNPTRHG